MVLAAALPGQEELVESPERIKLVFQKEAACGWEGMRRAAEYEVLEDESTEWAKGRWRTAAEGCHEEEKDLRTTKK